MNNTNPPQRPLSSSTFAASNDPPHRKQSTASSSSNHRRSSSNSTNLDSIEYVVGNNSSTSLSNNNLNNNKTRSSLLSPLHESSSSSKINTNNNGNKNNDPDYNSPSLPFSPYSPPTLLSQRFNHESDNEDGNNNSYDDDPDDSDRTEGSEMTSSMAKNTAVASAARLKATKRPTYGNVLLSTLQWSPWTLFFFHLTYRHILFRRNWKRRRTLFQWAHDAVLFWLRAGDSLLFVCILSHRHTEATCLCHCWLPEQIFFFPFWLCYFLLIIQ